MKHAGYLLNTSEGLTGEAGLFYDYIFAGNGLFVRTQNTLLKTAICISPIQIRGLLPLEEEIEFTHGKIPQALYNLAVSLFIAGSDREHYLAVTWENQYHLKIPPQDRYSGSVRYERLPSTILDIHSHGVMESFFSGTDNADEQGLCLYMVVGRLDTLLPEVEKRLGVYGYFAPVTLAEIFNV